MPPKTTPQAYYIVTAFIHQVKIDRDVLFQSRVLWKRKDNKVQTKTAINNKKGGIAVFEEKLSLPLTFVYDNRQKRFLQKKTDFYSVVVTQKGLKSGGSVSYDVSKILNQGLENQIMKMKLSNSPDPNAYIQISFTLLQKNQPFLNKHELGISSVIQNTSIMLDQNLHQYNNNLNSKVNPLINVGLKQSTKQNKLSIRKSRQNQIKKQNLLSKMLQQKINFLQSTLKQASKQISKRDKQISQLKQNRQIDYKSLYQEQVKKNLVLQNKLFEYESNCISKVQESVIQELKSQLSDVKFSIGKLLNSADDIGGQKLVHQLCTSIGIGQTYQTN